MTIQSLTMGSILILFVIRQWSFIKTLIIGSFTILLLLQLNIHNTELIPWLTYEKLGIVSNIIHLAFWTIIYVLIMRDRD